MLQEPDFPTISDLLAFEEDGALSEPSPELFEPVRRSLRGIEEEGAEDGLGFRSLLERPEALRAIRRFSRSATMGR